MPFYEYRCKACDHRFEVLQRMSDEPVTACESCGAEEAERVLYAPAIHFKGSGFHNTDYGTRRRPVGGDSDGGSSEGSGNGASSDGGSGGSSDAASSSSPAPASSSSTVGLDKV
ncbi:MAG: zinc ribbon domain-containing protein [Miltoncostaeaceae bacterium]